MGQAGFVGIEGIGAFAFLCIIAHGDEELNRRSRLTSTVLNFSVTLILRSESDFELFRLLAGFEIPEQRRTSIDQASAAIRDPEHRTYLDTL